MMEQDVLQFDEVTLNPDGNTITISRFMIINQALSNYDMYTLRYSKLTYVNYRNSIAVNYEMTECFGNQLFDSSDAGRTTTLASQSYTWLIGSNLPMREDLHGNTNNNLNRDVLSMAKTRYSSIGSTLEPLKELEFSTDWSLSMQVCMKIWGDNIVGVLFLEHNDIIVLKIRSVPETSDTYAT